jgi:hypothetical protein
MNKETYMSLFFWLFISIPDTDIETYEQKTYMSFFFWLFISIPDTDIETYEQETYMSLSFWVFITLVQKRNWLTENFKNSSHVTIDKNLFSYHGGLGDDVGETVGDGKGEDLLGGTGGGGGGKSRFPAPGESKGEDRSLTWKHRNVNNSMLIIKQKQHASGNLFFSFLFSIFCLKI